MTTASGALLAFLWASLFWLVLLGIPFALPAVTALTLVVLAAGMPLWAAAAALLAALGAELLGRHWDRAFARARGREAVAVAGGLLVLGLVLGPNLGSAAWGISIGEGGRALVASGKRIALLFCLGRLVRGGVALGLALWLFLAYVH